MKSQCLNKVPACIDPLTGRVVDTDNPFRNLSSEAIDVTTYRRFVPNWSGENPDDPTRVYRAQGCLSLCESTVSMEEALLCAQRQAAICYFTPPDPPPYDPDPWQPPGDGGFGPPGPNPNTPGGPGGGGGTPQDPDDKNWPPYDPNPPQVFYSAAATCTVLCPDGVTPFSKTVEAGKFVNRTQALADKQAREYACEQAMLLRVCIGPIEDKVCCLYSAMDPTTITFGGGLGPYTIALEGAPGGVDAVMNVGGSSATLSGTPTVPGDYDLTFRVTGPRGDSVEKSFSIKVIGILPAPSDLGKWPRFTHYSKTFSTAGFIGTVTWYGQSLPSGLAMDAGGTVSGIPTGEGVSYMTISALDEEGHACTNIYRLEIVDCATATFGGSISYQLGGSSSFSTQITPQPCERSLTIKTTDFRLNMQACFSGGYIEVILRDGDGNQQGLENAGLSNPYGADINWFPTIPAQYTDEDKAKPWTLDVSILIGEQLEGCEGSPTFGFSIDGI